MTAPALYLHLPGTAAEALEFYQGVFGGETSTATYAEFGRTDGPGSAVAHGTLSGAVDLYVSDAGEHDEPFSARGLMVALLGAAEPTTLRTWFAALAEGGDVVDPLQRRDWGASDGQVRDRYGVLWLIGYEHGTDPTADATSTQGDTTITQE
ncbi:MULTISPECIES: VOC family protein [Brachybacterium]|uniref:VOC family protein n=2 Tax=Brachybacterium TaxID=43668 RepID=A0A3R8QWF1_9MICO|nr:MULTISPECIES: VOC family protein [Brachybacterium]RRR20306.1 VOC family protein [Brachybacterium paraconglomeratum]TDP78978.1 PhnB protein [Brachybacterium sp. AG952]GAP79587.1 phnB protein [Brachybacterium sp. SW0106-09]GLI32185.1 VOC family protein [Brachybacterium conglomeratum]GLK03719.1 VOC family protein [Brachybacterium conglomeratum]